MTVKKKRRNVEVSLPTELSEPKQNLCDYTMLLYGERKIGKTTLASQFEDPFFFMFEPGGNALRLRQRPIDSWDTFLEYITLLEDNPTYCKTVILDTGAVAYEKCMQYVCEREGMIHPSDGEYGRGWKLVADEFKRAHDKLFNLGVGLIITAHSEIKTMQKRNGEKCQRISMDLSGAALKFYSGVVDIIAYYQYDDSDGRMLTIRGDSNVEAGIRLEENFRYTDGTQVEHIPMGESKEESYENFIDAFNNETVKKKVVKKVLKKKKKS